MIVAVQILILGITAGLTLNVSVARATSMATTTHHELLPGNRIVPGTVTAVRSGQAQVSTGDVQPRFLPLKVRRDKGLPELKAGDRVEITLNDQNLLVDVHLPGESSHHRIVYGRLAQPLVTGHSKAIVRTAQGDEESHLIRPLARSKVASIPVGIDVLFLIDEHERIADVTFLTKESVEKARLQALHKSPLKNNFDRVYGVIVEPLKDQVVAVRSDEGSTRAFLVRPLIQQKMERLTRDTVVVLLVDQVGKVTDVAIP